MHIPGGITRCSCRKSPWYTSITCSPSVSAIFTGSRVTGCFCHILKLFKDFHPIYPEISPVHFKIESRPERRRIPGIVHHNVGDTKTRGSKSQRPHTGTGINKKPGRGFSHMLFNRPDLRITRARELDMDKRLLFIHDKRAGGKGKDIGPHIAPGEKIVHFWARTSDQDVQFPVQSSRSLPHPAVQALHQQA